MTNYDHRVFHAYKERHHPVFFPKIKHSQDHRVGHLINHVHPKVSQ